MIRRFLELLLIPVCVIACTKAPKDDAARTSRQLSLQLNSEPLTLDPSRVEDGLGFRVITNLMDGLMGFDNEGKLAKRLAESIEISPDLRTYRIKIRPDAVWSDGVAVDAAQFKFAIERALDPKTGAKLSGLLKWIEKIEAKDHELVFRLKQPVSFFEQILALPITYPLRKDILEANGGKWDPLRAWDGKGTGKAVPTNGAYRITRYVPDQEFLLEAARPLPPKAPTSVLLRIVNDESTGASLFEQKKLDVLTRIPAFDQVRYEKAGSVRKVPFQATYFFSFNRKKAPFDRVEFRRAFAAAVRKDEIVKVLGTGEIAASAWVAPGQEGYFEWSGSTKPEVKSAVSTWKGEILIGFDSSGRNATVAEKVQADLKAAYGWNVRLVNQEWKSYVRGVYADPEMIFRFGWSSPMIDPAVHLLAFMTNDPFTFTRYANPKYDQLITEIVALQPSEVRTQKIIEAQKILLEEDVVVVPIYHYVSTFALGPRVAKYGMNPLGYTIFEYVEMK